MTKNLSYKRRHQLRAEKAPQEFHIWQGIHLRNMDLILPCCSYRKFNFEFLISRPWVPNLELCALSQHRDFTFPGDPFLSAWGIKIIIPREMVLCTYSRRGPLRAWPAGVAWPCHIPHDTLFSRQRVTKPQMVHQSQEMAEADREADESSSQSWLEKEGGPPDLRNALPPTCRSYLVSAEARIDRNRRPLP